MNDTAISLQDFENFYNANFNSHKITKDTNKQTIIQQHITPQKIDTNETISESSTNAYIRAISEQKHQSYFQYGQLTPGYGKQPMDICGKYRTRACLDESCNFIQVYPHSCNNAMCSKCAIRSIHRTATNATNRIASFCNFLYTTHNNPFSKKLPTHRVISPNNDKQELYKSKATRDKEREYIRKKEQEYFGTIGNMEIYHPYRYTPDIEKPYFSPHTHTISFGWLDTKIVDEFSKETGYTITYLSTQYTAQETYNTIFYLLTHAGIIIPEQQKYGYKPKHIEHLVRYTGELNYRKFKTIPVLSKSISSYNDIDNYTAKIDERYIQDTIEKIVITKSNSIQYKKAQILDTKTIDIVQNDLTPYNKYLKEQIEPIRDYVPFTQTDSNEPELKATIPDDDDKYTAYDDLDEYDKAKRDKLYEIIGLNDIEADETEQIDTEPNELLTIIPTNNERQFDEITIIQAEIHTICQSEPIKHAIVLNNTTNKLCPSCSKQFKPVQRINQPIDRGKDHDFIPSFLLQLDPLDKAKPRFMLNKYYKEIDPHDTELQGLPYLDIDCNEHFDLGKTKKPQLQGYDPITRNYLLNQHRFKQSIQRFKEQEYKYPHFEKIYNQETGKDEIRSLELEQDLIDNEPYYQEQDRIYETRDLQGNTQTQTPQETLKPQSNKIECTPEHLARIMRLDTL